MKITVYGTVQGVGFRPTVYRVAKSLGLRGYVLNAGSCVEIFVDRDHEKFLRELKKALPPIARIEEIKLERAEEKYSDFRILESRWGQTQPSFPSIPVDTAICDECGEELFDRKNRRYMYPFTNCTKCGERFSLLRDLPYDRVRTSMNEFPMCPKCKSEYDDPKDRRFHHQTISCATCGPKYTLYDKKGVEMDGCIETFAEMIDDGMVGIAKSWGGMHIICTFDKIALARKIRRRRSKPFAIMLRDIETVKKYAEVGGQEKLLLTSPQRPIVLLDKRDSTLDALSPGLGNIGIYIPYSAFHYVLFHHLRSEGVIMTSTNMPSEPMIIKNEDAVTFGAECYVLHNREIVNRVDDSVARIYKNRKFLLRKSRGFVPSMIKVPYKEKILSVGAEENVSVAVSKDGVLYSSQYIGDTKTYATQEFLASGTSFILRLLGIENKEIDRVAIDLHPRYATRRFGKNFGNIVEIQHHWAHATSLMADNGVEDEIVALTLDGTGYGSDGKLWGGEVLRASYKKFGRVGSLESIPLLGGDAAINDPKRVVFAIFEKLGLETGYFKDREAEILRRLMPRSPLTSSFGRVLDALSCYLGICTERTYDGEPAMRLEKYIARGTARFEFKTEIKNSQVMTTPLFGQLYGMKIKNEKEKCDAAHSFVKCLLEELTGMAVNDAKKEGIKFIGITGGVSYNTPIVSMVEKFVRAEGLRLLVHNEIPNGDGGIAVGQNVIAGRVYSTAE
jgi:hydrogenase maturation protein HypF